MRIYSFLMAMLALVCCCSLVSAASETFVQIADGAVNGEISSDGLARAFRGIPYSSPPVGELRFEAPTQVQPWGGVLDATVDGAACPQVCMLPSWACPPVTDEDCLYLNVFTPRLAQIKSKLPVMVFLHGGNFFQGYGGGELYDGKYIANDTSTILVSINYRLGILGYMASEKIEGNFGLQDQIQALNWVQKNIGAFGGDPERVTLFGQSAGSMSTAALLNCPAAEGLFSKAIMESEPFALPFRTLETYKPVARDWFKFLGCAYNDVECVRNIDSDTIIKSQTYLMQDLLANLEQPLALFTPFTPLLDTKLVPMPPMDALKNGVSRSMPVMLGNTAQEGNLFVFEALPKPTPTIEYWALADLIFSPKLGTKITTKYAVPSGETDARVTMSNATTDGIFICPNRNATRGWANAQAGRENVWYYIFDHPPSDGSAWGNQTYCAHVSCHGEDLPFVFHFIDPSVFNFTAAEVQLSWTMVDYWTNFAHTGNPNGVTGLNRRQITTAAKSAFPNVAISESHLTHWPAYVTETSLSMHFSTPNVYIDTRYKGDTCDWWDAEIGYVFP